MMWQTWCMLAAGAFCLAPPLAAQENRGWSERAFLTIDLPFQTLKNDFSESLSFADNVRRAENVTFLMRYPSTRGALVDVGGGVRLATNLGVGLTASWSNRSDSSSFELEMPNPLVANSPLELAGSISELRRREVGFHMQALYAVAIGNNVRVIAGGGPSIFNTRQDVVRSLDVNILPGFRSLQFDQAVIARDKQTSVGFNLGADITWKFASHFGVGTVTRYSRANVTWKPESASGVSRAIETRAGGLHIGVGLRLLF